jgi:hypothetical protein
MTFNFALKQYNKTMTTTVEELMRKAVGGSGDNPPASDNNPPAAEAPKEEPPKEEPPKEEPPKEEPPKEESTEPGEESQPSAEDIELKEKLEEEERLKEAAASNNEPEGGKKDDAPEKSFDELYAERIAKETGGKFKSISEIVEAAQSQQPAYASEEIKQLNEYVKGGGKLDEQFWYLKSSDFSKLTPEQVHLEAMSLNPEYKGYSREELMLELDDKYRRDEWSENAEERDKRELLARKRFERDAEMERERLLELQQKTSFSPKQPTEAERREAEQAAQKQKEEWDDFVENEIISKTPKLSSPIDDKGEDIFDFEIPQATQQKISEVVKEMRTDVNAFWNLFKNDRGEYDFKAIYETLVLRENREDILKLIAKNYRAVGAKEEIKRIKNINFKTDGRSVDTKKETAQEKTAKNLMNAMFPGK